MKTELYLTFYFNKLTALLFQSELFAKNESLANLRVQNLSRPPFKIQFSFLFSLLDICASLCRMTFAGFNTRWLFSCPYAKEIKCWCAPLKSQFNKCINMIMGLIPLSLVVQYPIYASVMWKHETCTAQTVRMECSVRRQLGFSTCLSTYSGFFNEGERVHKTRVFLVHVSMTH